MWRQPPKLRMSNSERSAACDYYDRSHLVHERQADFQENAWTDHSKKWKMELGITLQCSFTVRDEDRKTKKEQNACTDKISCVVLGQINSKRRLKNQKRGMDSELGVEFTSSRKRKKFRGAFLHPFTSK
ncbi:uncharacterized protein LOC132060935 isoform X3 [Lycium ferocissimum]|uniref:uncharacterized protein LOC132060935 isoform X3 n=1 Tax=Lycium ferocissimum TaxID=112874 RepID=UPI0028160110|nr:uncharacterized protein LOC132060935 isoform X3 [Lycium ferocissimum]